MKIFILKTNHPCYNIPWLEEKKERKRKKSYPPSLEKIDFFKS